MNLFHIDKRPSVLWINSSSVCSNFLMLLTSNDKMTLKTPDVIQKNNLRKFFFSQYSPIKLSISLRCRLSFRGDDMWMLNNTIHSQKHSTILLIAFTGHITHILWKCDILIFICGSRLVLSFWWNFQIIYLWIYSSSAFSV